MNIINKKSKSILFPFIFLIFSIPCFCQNPITKSSAFGKVFTPKGDLRILIIYAGFDGYDFNQPYHNWGFGNDMPAYNYKDLFYSDFSQFAAAESDTINTNLSKYYSTFSSKEKPLRIIADVLPSRINIDPRAANNFGDCNRLVIEKMKMQYPDFDWTPYDHRTNFPNYQFDNSITSPDKKPDYVIIAYRYYFLWPKQPKEGMQRWAGNYSKLDGLHGLNYNGFSFDGAGFTLAAFEGKPHEFWNLFVHELAHELFSCPHYSGANGAIGNYFFQPMLGWDMMNRIGGQTCNGFERWVLGWIDIKHDLKNVKDNGTYFLDDYVASGEVIRIKIPNTPSQYLWIENHQKKSIFDKKPWRGALYNIPQGTKGIADKETGLYMYIEDVIGDRSEIQEGLVYNLNKVNGIMPLHAEGNFDYEKPVKFTHSPEECWNNKLYWFEKGRENPISGVNPYMGYRHDFDNNGKINHISGPFSEYNGMKDTETFPISKEILGDQPILTYASMGGRNADAKKFKRSDAFQEGDVIDLNSNPVITNRPLYNKEKQQMQSFFLNGLSIKIIEIKNGRAKLEIAFNQTTINKNVRWCGNITCKPVENAPNDIDLLVTDKARITLDKSGTPNKLNTPFINATMFTVDSGAVVRLDKKSALEINQGTTIIIKKGGKLVIGKTAELILDESSFLTIEEGGILEIEKKGKVNYNNPENFIFAPNSIVDPNGKSIRLIK